MEQVIYNAIEILYGIELAPVITRPEPQFGDAATNVALQLAGRLGKNPREVAEEIAEHLRGTGEYDSVEIAGPGFINVRYSDAKLLEQARRGTPQIYEGVSYVTEYSCPNAFKELHTGHLYQTILGDVIARLIERSGATVHRTSFGGDVGLHVAKCMYGILQKLGGENPDGLDSVSADPFERASWISACYVAGAGAYESDEAAKQIINDYNAEVYRLHNEQVTDTPFARIYFTCRQWSYDYFDVFYDLIRVEKQHYYPESTTASKGLELVKQLQEAGKLIDSEGAVIYPGDEAAHLDPRVFITSKGVPTYETKDLGVIFKERDDYDFTRRFLITGSEQLAYMRSVFAVADMVQPGIKDEMTHITNGLVKFGDGQKMSSRLGNVARAVDALDVVKQKVGALVTDENLVHDVALGAVKYQFLKYRVGGDIEFDVEDSVSLAGNSGPYLQYAHARVCSILEKAGDAEVVNDGVEYDAAERALVRKMGENTEVVERAARELMPHYICNYLYELAQEFNRFYEKSHVIGDERQAIRLGIITLYRDILAANLSILGIAAPERM